MESLNLTMWTKWTLDFSPSEAISSSCGLEATLAGAGRGHDS